MNVEMKNWDRANYLKNQIMNDWWFGNKKQQKANPYAFSSIELRNPEESFIEAPMPETGSFTPVGAPQSQKIVFKESTTLQVLGKCEAIIPGVCFAAEFPPQADGGGGSVFVYDGQYD